MALSSLLYASTARPGLTRGEIDAILTDAARNNSALGITGVLAFDGNGFAQIIEGETKTVESLYARIARDPRHSGCVRLSFSTIEERRFPDWSMGYRSLSDLVLIHDMAESDL
ncbi:BLUF domain-containing protein [Pararhizobium mangrovi]|uniref:BLUF domain-containing protein n=1 Tax=Pararhizobium mangrovi TaxID=2590452 RepID=A0A506U127_9HYPH|nr:BLUF domain-containing protein [Pararhizobium mangrovi]TPW26921.1 BLUF domain-containing protein [Pararhizobium mangrovi]